MFGFSFYFSKNVVNKLSKVKTMISKISRLIALVWLMALPQLALAEWTMIQTHDEGNMYIDFDSLTKADGLVTVTTLNDYYITQVRGELSSQWTELHDCNNRRFKALAISYYKDKMGQGNILESFTLSPDEIQWSEVVPYSVGALKANIICSR